MLNEVASFGYTSLYNWTISNKAELERLNYNVIFLTKPSEINLNIFK